MRDDPFTVLGLPAGQGLTDDDVRSAWRRIAAASHPDREDGGDPVLFSRAAAAYAELRTADGRGEALAAGATRAGTSLAGTGPGRRARHRRPRRLRVADPAAAGAAATGRAVGGRAAVAAAACAAAILAAGWSPATVAILAGALAWLLRPAWRVAWRCARDRGLSCPLRESGPSARPRRSPRGPQPRGPQPRGPRPGATSDTRLYLHFGAIIAPKYVHRRHGLGRCPPAAYLYRDISPGSAACACRLGQRPIKVPAQAREPP